MSRKRRRELEIALTARRNKIADLVLAGLSQAEIGRRLGVNQSTVCRDVQRLLRLWHEEQIHKAALFRGRESARLQHPGCPDSSDEMEG